MGDTLIFPALTIHGALPNYTEDKMRISLDNRYQAIGDTVADHMLEPHGPCQLGWEDVYETWSSTSDDLKYYWQQLENPVVPRDMSYVDQGFAEALELARSGNEHALFLMQRTIKNKPDTPAADAAKALMAELEAA